MSEKIARWLTQMLEADERQDFDLASRVAREISISRAGIGTPSSRCFAACERVKQKDSTGHHLAVAKNAVRALRMAIEEFTEPKDYPT